MGQGIIVRPIRKAVWRYALVMPAVVLAVGGRMLLNPVLGERVPFATFFLAVILISWYGGLGPALLTLVLSAVLAGYLFVLPVGTLAGATVTDWIGLVLFVAVSTVIMLLNESFRRSQREAEASHRRAVREREELRTTLMSLGDAVIVTDDQARVRTLNPVAERLTGWSLQQAQGKPLEQVFVLLDEISGAAVENPVSRVLKTGCVVAATEPIVLKTKDGGNRPIEESAAPIRDEQGNVHGVVLIFRDSSRSREIEQRRVARLAVTQTLAQASAIQAAAESILQAVCDNLSWDVGVLWKVDEQAQRIEPFDVYCRDPAAVSAFVSATRVASFGRDTSLPGRVWDTAQPHWIADVSRDVDFARATAAARCGIHGAFACPVFLGNQVLGVIEFYSREIRQPDEDLLEMMTTLGGQLGQFFERVRAQQELQEHLGQLVDAEQRLRFLADASRSLALLVDSLSTMQRIASLAVPFFADWCAVHMPDQDGRLRQLAVAHVDPAKVQLVKAMGERYPAPSDSSVGAASVFRSGQSEWFAEIPEQLLRRSAQSDEHLEMLRQLGLKSYICAPIKLKDRVLGTIAFASAESARRYTEEDLEVAEDLAHRAAIAIENQRLYAELRDEHRRKDEFLAMLAHELRNPLAPISSGLEMMALRGIEPQSVALMKEQVQHLVRLVDDLLDISRIMRGKIQLRKERVEVASVVRHAVETLRCLIESQEQILTVVLPPEPITVDGDPVRLAQVVINLLNNAAKYTPRGGQIWVAVQRSGDRVQLSVRDNGIGIDRQLLPRVFDLFIQSDRSLERSQGGLGIGLTLVRSLVEMHGGSVTAFSQGEGQGSEFTVRLPALPPQSSVDPPAAQVPARGMPRRVLIVDDNLAGAKMLGLLLNKLGGHQVQIVHDGAAAIDAAQAAPPEIILLDIGLPGTNGYEVAERLRKNPRLDQTLIVALTGYGSEEDRRRSLAAGFDLHLVKPPALEQLKQIFQHPKLHWPDRSQTASERSGPEHNGDETTALP